MLQTKGVMPEIDHALGSCAAICRQTLDHYEAEVVPTPISRDLVTVIAALDTARAAGPTKRRQALAVAAHVASTAAENLHRYGLGDDILRCAAACHRAAELCRKAGAH